MHVHESVLLFPVPATPRYQAVFFNQLRSIKKKLAWERAFKKGGALSEFRYCKILCRRRKVLPLEIVNRES